MEPDLPCRRAMGQKLQLAALALAALLLALLVTAALVHWLGTAT